MARKGGEDLDDEFIGHVWLSHHLDGWDILFVDESELPEGSGVEFIPLPPR